MAYLPKALRGVMRPPPPRPPTADLKMVESGRCPGQRRRMFSRGFISSVVNNVFLVSFCGGALRGLFPKRVPVPLCSAPEAGSDTATQLDQSTHCDRAVWMCGCTCRRHKDTTVQSQCPPVCDGHPWGGPARSQYRHSPPSFQGVCQIYPACAAGLGAGFLAI